MLQLQFEPGSIPSASTSATNVATGGSTATGCTAAATGAGAVGAGTDAGVGDAATVVSGVVGVDPAEIAGRGTDVAGVGVMASVAPVVALTVVQAGSGLEDGTDAAPWGRRAMTVVTARMAVRHAAMRRTRRCLPRRVVRLIFRLIPSTRPVSEALTRAGGAGGVLSTMC
jgi:hypothetical protein